MSAPSPAISLLPYPVPPLRALSFQRTSQLVSLASSACLYMGIRAQLMPGLLGPIAPPGSHCARLTPRGPQGLAVPSTSGPCKDAWAVREGMGTKWRPLPPPSLLIFCQCGAKPGFLPLGPVALGPSSCSFSD